MRILAWHGWLLEGTGSNVYAARVAAEWRRQGHDVALLCQQPRPERFEFVDASGTVDARGVSELAPTPARPATGRVVCLRPAIGRLLPVFVYDEYEGFAVKRFVDLTDDELAAYLDRNVAALRAAVAWHRPDAVVAGHAIPGAVVARRALDGARYVAKIHGSDLEYAIRLDRRYRELAREGLGGAALAVGASEDVLRRTVQLAPEAEGRTRVVPPGVEIDRWRPRPREDALARAAERLEADPDRRRGRPTSTDDRVAGLLAARDAAGLHALAASYDQGAPDPGAARRLRALAGHRGPLVGYLGKLIPEKGVERLVEAFALLPPDARLVLVGFGGFREWIAALAVALDRGDGEAARWLAEASPMKLELSPDEVAGARGIAGRVAFTGRLDHRYAPAVVAGLDVLVVPSTLDEAFGMVAAEGAAAGALPLVARHSALAEVARALERAAGFPDALSFAPGPGATRRLADALRRLLELPPAEAGRIRAAVRGHVASEWTWERTSQRLLAAAAGEVSPK
ncbi:MAG TPA: glycosyltransferase [Actinomycetota bacterium]|nr:glycosyltransferase [Actinomycetota bacterium]